MLEPSESETVRAVASLVSEGLAFRCVRTVLAPTPRFGGGLLGERSRKARITTYHLTDAGRERWQRVG